MFPINELHQAQERIAELEQKLEMEQYNYQGAMADFRHMEQKVALYDKEIEEYRRVNAERNQAHDEAVCRAHDAEQKCITYEAQLAEKDVQLADMQHWIDRCAELEAENARLKDEKVTGDFYTTMTEQQRDKAVEALREIVEIYDPYSQDMGRILADKAEKALQEIVYD